MHTFKFTVVNVFSADPLGGNPLAVVHAAEGLNEAQMSMLARWTNLSETAFILPATKPEADYQVRIFTPEGELPFAGHPTLGSCHAWPAAGGTPHVPGIMVQQCGIGLVRIHADGSKLEFAAPPLRRIGALEPDVLATAVAALNLSSSEVVRHQWVDNGSNWCALVLRSAEQVLSLKPDWAILGPLKLGVIGAHCTNHDADFEVRAFSGYGKREDPITGSLNAGLAQWLMDQGLAKPSYVAAQGTVLHRAGRVHLRRAGKEVWVGGDSASVIQGEIRL